MTTFLKCLLAMAILAAPGCHDASTAPARRSLPPHAPSLTALSDLPAPVLTSAVVVGTVAGYDFPIVRLSFTDTADDEVLANVAFDLADGTHLTQSIGGTPTTGDRIVDVYVTSSTSAPLTARVNYMWKDPTAAAICGCVFGPFSSAVAVTSTVTTTSGNGKAKGRR